MAGANLRGAELHAEALTSGDAEPSGAPTLGRLTPRGRRDLRDADLWDADLPGANLGRTSGAPTSGAPTSGAPTSGTLIPRGRRLRGADPGR